MNPAERASIAPKDRRVSFAPAKIAPRVCSVCGAKDKPALDGDHSVTIELRYLKSRGEFTPQLEARGWRYRKHQARDAMERFICRIPCLIATREMAREFQRKRDKELGAKNYDHYYLAVCGE